MKGKKIAIILSFALCIVFCLPSVPVLAFNSEIPGVCSYEAVSDYDFGLPLDSWSGGVEGSGDALSHFVKPSDCFPYVNSQIDERGVFTALSKLNTLEINLDDYYYALGGNYGPNIAAMSLFLIPKSGQYINDSICGGYGTYNGSSTGSGANSFGLVMSANNVPSDVTSIPIDFYTISWSGGSNWGNWIKTTSSFGRRSVDNLNSIFYFLFPSGYGQSYNLMFSNIDFFFLSYGTWKSAQKNESSGNYTYTTFDLPTFCNKHFGITDEYPKGTTGWFNLTQCPYYNGSEIVEPSAGFDDTVTNNAIAFSQYNAYVTYNRGVGAQSNFHTEWAMDQNAFDYSTLPLGWHMHYTMQVSYSVNMSADSAVYKPLINKNYYGDVNVQFDDDLATFASLTNGFRDFTMSEIINKQGAVATGNGVGALSLIIYGMTNNRSTVFGNPSFLGSDLTTFIDQAVAISGMFGYEIQAMAEAIVPTYTYSLDQLEINITAQAWNDNGMRSRYATRHLNMVNGQNSGIAQGAIYEQESTGDTIIVPDKNTNNNVYLTPTYDPTTNDYQLTIQIPEITVNNGFGTDSGSSSSNSSSTSQGGYASASVSIPDNMALTLIDDALEKFMKVMNAPVASVQPTFWGFFGLFKDNPIADIYEDYFGFLPQGFKDYILALCGIGFGTTVFCACRRKLT